MAWIMLDCELDQHAKIALLSENDARWGWIVVLMRAKKQSRPGRFASLAHLRYILSDDLAPFVDEYVRVRLLDVAKNGTVTVHDWNDYQRDKTDNTAAERQRRHREKLRDHEGNHAKRNGVTSVTGNASPARGGAVPVPVDVSVLTNEEEATQVARLPIVVPVKGMNGQVTQVDVTANEPSDTARLQLLAEELTQQPYVMANVHGGLGAKAVAEQLTRHGFARVERAWRQIANRAKAEGSSAPTLRQLVFGADDILNPLPGRAVVDKAEREEEERASFDRRVKRTHDELAKLRGETT